MSELGEWQLCPKCLGNGIIQNPMGMASTALFIGCDVCNGSKILARPLLNSEQNPERSVATEAKSELPNAGFIPTRQELNAPDYMGEISKLQSQIKGLVVLLEKAFLKAEEPLATQIHDFLKSNYYNSIK